MKRKWINSSLALRVLIVLFFVFSMFVVVRIVKAALYNINTTDETVQEWFDQGIEVFQTDPSGDVPNGDEDILNAWVATGDDFTFYFMMELNAETPLESMLRHAVAYIDCDMDGDNDGAGDPDDILITYETHEDSVWIMRGDQNQGQSLSSLYGQRVNYHVEWGLPFSFIPPYNPGINDSDCLSDVQIRFFTANTETQPGTYIDETSPFKGYNVYPNVVKLDSLEAKSKNHLSALYMLLLGLLFVVLVAGGALFFKRKSINFKHQK